MTDADISAIDAVAGPGADSASAGRVRPRARAWRDYWRSLAASRAVRLLADEVCSTEKMVTYCKESPAKEIIIVTEAGMLHRLRKEIPDKLFIAGPTDRCACAECRFMKMNTLEKAHAALLNLEPEIVLPEPVRQRAELPIRRMLELSR